MHLTGLMLNRCDSVLGRQSQSSIMLDEKYNQTVSRSWIHPPQRPFFFFFFNFASHDDGANPPPTRSFFFFLEFNNGTNGRDGKQAAACVIRLRHMACTDDKAGETGSWFHLFIHAAYLHLTLTELTVERKDHFYSAAAFICRLFATAAASLLSVNSALYEMFVRNK